MSFTYPFLVLSNLAAPLIPSCELQPPPRPSPFAAIGGGTMELQRRYEAERWLEKLGDPEYSVRNAADRALRLMGRNAKEALLMGVKSSDPEIASRSRNILQGVLNDEMWDAYVFQVRVKNIPFHEAIELVSRKSRTPIGLRFAADGKPPASSISLDMKGNVWELLDEIAAQAGLAWSLTGDKNRTFIEFSPATPETKTQRVYSRDIVVEIARPIIHDPLKKSLRIPISIAAPGYRPLSLSKQSIQVLKAVTNRGEALNVQSTSFDEVESIWDPHGHQCHFIRGFVTVTAPARPCHALKDLSLSIPLQSLGGMHTCVIQDCSTVTNFSAGPVKGTLENYEVIPIDAVPYTYANFRVQSGIRELRGAPSVVVRTTTGVSEHATVSITPDENWADHGSMAASFVQSADFIKQISISVWTQKAARDVGVHFKNVMLPKE